MAQSEQLKPNSATELTLKQEPPNVVFMFPGGGAQYPNMGRALYEHEPVYRHHVDTCLALLQPPLGFDVRGVLFPQPDQLEQAAEKLRQPRLALPTLFTTCYALAQQWLAWGIAPTAMIGHSVGEYVAACLAGVMSLAEALATVTLRGELFETLPQGGMLNVTASQTEIQPWLTDELSLAVVNAPNMSVLSGPVVAIEALEERLASEEIPTQRIKISVAAHSAMLDPILDSFGQHMATLNLKPPQIPFVSNVTGTWITPEETTNPTYWVRHLRQTVRFADGINTLAEQTNQVYLEVGPGRGLAALIARHPDRKKLPTVISMPSARRKIDSQQRLLQALGGLCAKGVEVS